MASDVSQGVAVHQDPRIVAAVFAVVPVVTIVAIVLRLLLLPPRVEVTVRQSNVQNDANVRQCSQMFANHPETQC